MEGGGGLKPLAGDQVNGSRSDGSCFTSRSRVLQPDPPLHPCVCSPRLELPQGCTSKHTHACAYMHTHTHTYTHTHTAAQSLESHTGRCLRQRGFIFL